MLMKLLSPGCGVMMRLSLRAKMGLLAACLFLPLLVPAALVVQDLTSPGSPVAQGRWVLTLGGLLVSGLILLYFATAFVVDFKSRLQVLIDTMNAYAEGDLVPRAQLQGRDELSALGHTAERVAEKLSQIVAEMRSSAMRLSQTGESVAASASALAERTDEQAQHIVQAVQSVGQLSDGVAENAAASLQLDSTTRVLREEAERSGQLMTETAQAMTALEASSRKVGEFVGVIDSIAFQTNILALNAAVEAARAGESGRGFAVVAAEVRSLAQRSAGAAAEVRQLLAASGQQVTASAGRLHQVEQTLGRVVQGVQQVSTALRTIAETSSGQSAELSEIARGVGNLDALTRQNQQMVGDSTLSALELMDRAGRLANDVSAIRLRQGSADEARNLVDRAMSLIQRQGLAAAIAQMRQPGSGFVDRDLYVFITDAQGVYRLHTGNPVMEGRRVHEAPGIDGDRFVRESLAEAHGSHWVDYTITNPLSGLPQSKTSYVLPLEGDLVLGCGFYRHQLQQEQSSLGVTFM